MAELHYPLPSSYFKCCPTATQTVPFSSALLFRKDRHMVQGSHSICGQSHSQCKSTYVIIMYKKSLESTVIIPIRHLVNAMLLLPALKELLKIETIKELLKGLFWHGALHFISTGKVIAFSVCFSSSSYIHYISINQDFPSQKSKKKLNCLQ